MNKSLGVLFGGMTMIAGLSYLSRRSSGSKAEASTPLGQGAKEAIAHLNKSIQAYETVSSWRFLPSSPSAHEDEGSIDASFLCDGVSSEDCVKVAGAVENSLPLMYPTTSHLKALKSKPKRLKEVQKLLSRFDVSSKPLPGDVNGVAAAIALSCVQTMSPMPVDLLERIEKASRLPERVSRRVMAAEIERHGGLVCGNVRRIGLMLWDGHLAPSYPDLNRRDAAKVATGVPIQEVFAPVPIEKAKQSWGNVVSEEIRLQHLRERCPKLFEPARLLAEEEAKRLEKGIKKRTALEKELSHRDWRHNAFVERVSNSPVYGSWLDSVCGDPLRVDALVARREFPHPLEDGRRYESSYLEEMLQLFEDYDLHPEDISNVKSSPEAVHRSLRNRKARTDLEAYESAAGKKAAPVPHWWPKEMVEKLGEQGAHIRQLRTCQDVVKEGIELDHCMKDPKRYCPPVARGKSVIVSMEIEPKVDKSGALRTSSHRSTMELRVDGKGDEPDLAQHYGYRDAKVDDPRAIKARESLLEAIRKKFK